MPVCRECFFYQTNIQQKQQADAENAAAARSSEICKEPEEGDEADNGNESEMYFSALEEASSDEAEEASSGEKAQNIDDASD